MLTKTITRSVPVQPHSQPHYWLTPTTLTLAAASLQYYTPKTLSRGRLIAPKYLRILADWIGQPAPKLRSIRTHIPLAAHMALLHAAGFIAVDHSTTTHHA